MAEQLSLFGSPEPKQALEKPDRSAEQAKPESAPEPVAAYASVVLDIPTRALSEPFAYGIPRSLANEAQIGSTVLVHFGNRAAAGYIVDIAPELGDLQGNNALDLSRIKPVEAILSKPLFTAEAARIARWMSREYVATLSECLRLFLPPGGSPRVVKGGDGVWAVERPAVKPIQNGWVMLTPEGFDYTPPKTAVRQRQLIEALQCGPVTTRDLNLLYNSMSATIKALEKRGVVVVEGLVHPVLACSTPARDGMVVTTSSPRVDAYRRIALELIVADHGPGVGAPCFSCAGNGACELQDLCRELGVEGPERAVPRGA